MQCQEGGVRSSGNLEHGSRGNVHQKVPPSIQAKGRKTTIHELCLMTGIHITPGAETVGTYEEIAEQAAKD